MYGESLGKSLDVLQYTLNALGVFFFQLHKISKAYIKIILAPIHSTQFKVENQEKLEFEGTNVHILEEALHTH